jgi:flagellar protein FlaG
VDIRPSSNMGSLPLLDIKATQQDKVKVNDEQTTVVEKSKKLQEKTLQSQPMELDQVSKDELHKQVDGVNKILEANLTSLKFNVHEKLNRITVQILDKNSEEVVREIPPEKFLDMVASMLEFVGLIVDKKA